MKERERNRECQRTISEKKSLSNFMLKGQDAIRKASCKFLSRTPPKVPLILLQESSTPQQVVTASGLSNCALFVLALTALRSSMSAPSPIPRRFSGSQTISLSRPWRPGHPCPRPVPSYRRLLIFFRTRCPPHRAG